MKKKQKKKILKLIISVLLVVATIIISNNVAFAETEQNTESSTFNLVQKGLLGVLGGLIGIAVSPIIIIATITVTAGFLLVSVFSTGISDFQILTPASLFFNKIPLTNPMLFVSPEKASEAGLSEFALNVSEWFRIMMLLTVAILFLILIYLSIRAMLSNNASTISDIKEMLKNWGMSVVILMVLAIVIVGAIYLNDSIISALSNSLGEIVNFDKIIGGLFLNTIVFFSPILQVTSIILLGKLLMLTVEFLFAYIKRILNIAFLIIIAPLITVTYSVDKLGDKKAQAFSTWNKEFMGKIFIQPVHAILFYVTMSIVSSIANPGATNGLAAEIFGDIGFSPLHLMVAIISLDFIKDIEKLLMGMFDLGKGTSIKDGSTIAKAILGSQVVNYVGKKVGKKAESYVGDHIKYGRLKRDETPSAKLEDNSDEEAARNNDAQLQKNSEENYEVSADDMNLEGVDTVNPEDKTAIIENAENNGGEAEGATNPSIKDIEPPKLSKENKASRALKKATGAYANLFRSAYRNKWAYGSMIAGYGIMGGASGALTGYGVGSSIDKYTNTRSDFKKTRKEQLRTYNSGVDKGAEKAANLASTYSAITGQNMDPETKEGKAALRAFFNTLNQADSKENILQDFEKSIADYKKHLMDEKNYTLLEANTATQQLLSGLHSGTINLNTLDDKQRAVAASSVLKDAIEQKESFEKEFALIEGDYGDVSDRLFEVSGDPDYREIFNKYRAIAQVRALGAGANSASNLSRREKEIVNKFRNKIDNLTDDKKKELEKLEQDAKLKIEQYINEFGSKENIERTIKERYKDGYSLEDVIKEHDEKLNGYNESLNRLNEKLNENYNANLEPGEEKVELNETKAYTALEGYNEARVDNSFKNIVKDEVFDKKLKDEAKKEYTKESKEAVEHINKAIEQSRNEDIIKSNKDKAEITKKMYNELFGNEEKAKKTIEEFTKTTGKDAKELLDIKAKMEIELEKQLEAYKKEIEKLNGVTDVDIKNYNRLNKNENIIDTKQFDNAYNNQKAKGLTAGNYDKKYAENFNKTNANTNSNGSPLSADEFMNIKENNILNNGNSKN